jgi:glutamate carboxypeptidase
VIDDAALLDFLRRIVAMDSPTESKPLCDAVGDVLEAQAIAFGMQAERDPQRLVGDHRILRLRGGGKRRILLVGHFDTVHPAGSAAQRLRIEGERAYGPGILDMKGGLAMALFAIDAARRAAGGILPDDVTFVMNSDEETGSASSLPLILREAAAHDLALVLEPGRPGPALTIGRKGVGIFRIAVTGIEAHAGAEPEKGASAILAAARIALQAAELVDPHQGTSVNVGTLRGGTWPYVVAGAAELMLDVRVPSLAEQHRIERALATLVAAPRLPGTSATLSGRFHRPPMEATAASLAAADAFQRAGDALGFPLGLAVSGGASDGNNIAAAGIPTVDGLGPHGSRAHSDEEHIDLSSLFAKCAILARVLAEGASPERGD